MIRALIALLCLICLVAAIWAVPLWRGPAPAELAPRDIALAPEVLPDRPLRIAVLGTSLSHREPWTDRLGEVLGPCLGSVPEMRVAARPGVNVAGSGALLEPLIAFDPDLVLIEFAINDADLVDGLRPHRADEMTRILIAALAEALPGARVAEMTMSPAAGLRGLFRPRLAAHYDAVIARADTGGWGAVDLYRRWLALPRGARGLADGLHPEGRVAAEVIVPALAPYIAAAFGTACTVSAGASDNS